MTIDSDDIPIISSLSELLNEICWSYDYPRYTFQKNEDGNYTLDKLYIEPDKVSYKTSNWYLAPGVFKQFEELVNFLESTNEKI